MTLLPIVTLGIEHANQFAEFSCAGATPQQMVREHLAAALVYSPRPTSGLGIFDGGDLCSLIAWRPSPNDPETWQIPVLATAIGHTRRGYGERLKREVLALARAADPPVFAVTSDVQLANTAMLTLNAKLGAVIAIDPSDPDWRVCTIPIV